MAEQQYYEGIGRRKTSTARVRLQVGGKGSVLVNDKPGEVFFSRTDDYTHLIELLTVTGTVSESLPVSSSVTVTLIV